MKASDKPRFTQIMLGMADNFRDSISKPGMDMRWDMLKSFDISDLEAASKRIMAARKYTKMPPVAEFIEAINGQAPRIEDKALVIANTIIAHMRTHGSRAFPPLDHDATAKRLMTSRWPYYQWAAEVLTSEIQWWVKQFCEAYKAEQTVEQFQIGHDCAPGVRQITEGMLKRIA